MLAGRLMLSNKPPGEKVNYLMTAGVFMAIAGYFWGLAFPVNENLWTSSFVLVTSGFASLLFGVFYFLVDMKGRTWGTRPGIIFGANAITVYFLADVWALFFYEAKFGGTSLNEMFVNGLTNMGADPQTGKSFICIAFCGD